MKSFQEQINRAKEIHKILCNKYDIHIPLEFQNLNGKGGGYVVTTKLRKGKYHFLKKIVLDNSGRWCSDPDYCLCHEFAHVILIERKNSVRHDKRHANLTKKLAKEFNLI
ncbi:MAG: hypothetical protein KAT68_19535 [Bacteroidales bacterium]|nr:hypothetical protein [Bacteroidales bacterium]